MLPSHTNPALPNSPRPIVHTPPPPSLPLRIPPKPPKHLPLHLLIPTLPHILATPLPRPIVLFPLLLAIPLLDRLLLQLRPVALDAHAEPEILPQLRARPQPTRPVNGRELPARRLAVPGVVKGVAARERRGQGELREMEGGRGAGGGELFGGWWGRGGAERGEGGEP